MATRSRQDEASGTRSRATRSRRRAAQVGSLVLLALLAGCAGRGAIDRFSAVREVSPRQAFVMPSAGGPAIVGVLERTYSNGVEQDIVLAGGGAVAAQNVLKVQFIGPVDTATSGRSALSERPLATTDIARELRAEFPGIAMQRSPYYVQNRYGPFGYAVGRTGGTTCLYAWQRMTGSVDTTLLLRPRAIINMRLRRCDAGVSEAQLLATMYGLGVNSFIDHFSWVPYDAPPPPPPTLGASAAPIYPVAGAAATVLAEPAPAAAPAAAAPAPRRLARRAAPRPAPVAAPAQPPLPAPIGLPVPPPPGTAASAPTTSAPLAAPAAAASPASSVPVPPPPSVPGPAAPVPAVSAPAPQATAPLAQPVVVPPAICANGALRTAAGC
ncbi:cellulose biosynthesis protein BcsN [Antarcticirhabdus aurantiaca]|uniref:Cellulose biosynthesis protein BcsN n=1 Tax=Antarcticirhabdus aurantiaca TaxID=2606717 RepID=A0ACD4NPN8_9HYPH|nr:cellulose biosynthesis protein BcsN [Antarcticirhabdus aurantiaca]WAJ28800.1 cellulose biosynthesis protein BcsN [Jeongeuplla avenae]